MNSHCKFGCLLSFSFGVIGYGEETERKDSKEIESEHSRGNGKVQRVYISSYLLLKSRMLLLEQWDWTASFHFPLAMPFQEINVKEQGGVEKIKNVTKLEDEEMINVLISLNLLKENCCELCLCSLPLPPSASRFLLSSPLPPTHTHTISLCSYLLCCIPACLYLFWFLESSICIKYS